MRTRARKTSAEATARARRIARSRPAKLLGTLLALVIAVPGIIYLVPALVGADHSFVVLSGSMVPVFDPGDVIFVVDVEPDSLEVGDIVTFTVRPGSKMLVTHRVIEVVDDAGPTRYRTQGDANEDADPFIVHGDMVVGKYRGQVPYWGHIINVVHSKLGYVVFILAPGTIIILREGVHVYKALDAEDRRKQAQKAAKKAALAAPFPWELPDWKGLDATRGADPFPWELPEWRASGERSDPFPWELPSWGDDAKGASA